MGTTHIRGSIERTVGQLDEHPEEGRGTISAVAVLEAGLCVRAEGPGGFAITPDVASGVEIA